MLISSCTRALHSLRIGFSRATIDELADPDDLYSFELQLSSRPAREAVNIAPKPHRAAVALDPNTALSRSKAPGKFNARRWFIDKSKRDEARVGGTRVDDRQGGPSRHEIRRCLRFRLHGHQGPGDRHVAPAFSPSRGDQPLASRSPLPVDNRSPQSNDKTQWYRGVVCLSHCALTHIHRDATVSGVSAQSQG